MAIGKIQDLFAGRGIGATHSQRRSRNDESFSHGDTAGGLIFANLVDFKPHAMGITVATWRDALQTSNAWTRDSVGSSNPSPA